MNLKDFCAAIITGVTLHNGLTSKEGIVAAYAKDGYITTLYSHNTVNSIEQLELMLKTTSKNKPEINYNGVGFISATICESKKAGVEGLEKFLIKRGFKFINQNDEKDAANIYLNKFERKNKFSRINPFSKYDLKYIPTMGRELASAITLGQVGLIGDFKCSSIQGKKAPNHLDIDSPIEMGPLKVIAALKLADYHEKLIYINGKLRILKGTETSITPSNSMVLEIFPKLDGRGNQMLLSKYDFDLFVDRFYHSLLYTTSKNVIEPIALGCDNISKMMFQYS